MSSTPTKAASAAMLAVKAEAVLESFKSSNVAIFVGGPRHGESEALAGPSREIHVPVLTEHNNEAYCALWDNPHVHRPIIERYILERLRIRSAEYGAPKDVPYFRHESLSVDQATLIFMGLLLSSFFGWKHR